ncbi:MAG: hypothetical protein OEY00_14040, partial [Gammaproteobacteria bacterium]|nr:hypothetical protein [Gammaproteobacteria bacterium]
MSTIDKDKLGAAGHRDGMDEVGDVTITDRFAHDDDDAEKTQIGHFTPQKNKPAKIQQEHRPQPEPEPVYTQQQYDNVDKT